MRRCLLRAMYLRTSAVAVSTWGAISSARPRPLTTHDIVAGTEVDSAALLTSEDTGRGSR